jgi:hypothetical protein
MSKLSCEFLGLPRHAFIKRQGGNVFHSELQCYVDKVEYDPRARIGRVYCGGCTDMDGCIVFFQRIDKEVRRIETFWDGKPDTIYLKDRSGKWEGCPPGECTS